MRDADVGFRIRSQVVATNAEGSATSTSNPTEVVRSARPLNVSPPTIAGAAAAGSTLTAAAGEWVGTTPITYSFRWLRCDPTGSRCVEIPRATGTSYLLAQEDVGATMRVRVTARNDAGAASALSPQTGVVQPGVPPTGPIPATSLQPGGDQLVVSRVVFSPTPVTSRRAPIVVRILVSARAGRPVSGVTVFVRATPRVAQGQSALTDTSGWATLTLVPNARFPKPKAGYNVQFFVRAYRVGDATRNLDGYRLVQVPLAG
ncbi:MAG: hypothetical protein RMM28_00415 [Thermoleophilia bacterium]|nr:hypothetical protein [Thermoleophilia bacterium]